jgi:hypothetical protein
MPTSGDDIKGTPTRKKISNKHLGDALHLLNLQPGEVADAMDHTIFRL